MALQLTTISFSVQLRGDGTSTQVVVDLTSGAAQLQSNIGGALEFTKNLNISSAVDVSDVSSTGGFVVTGSLSSGKVTLTFNTAPSAGQFVTVSGLLVFNGS